MEDLLYSMLPHTLPLPWTLLALLLGYLTGARTTTPPDHTLHQTTLELAHRTQ